VFCYNRYRDNVGKRIFGILELMGQYLSLCVYCFGFPVILDGHFASYFKVSILGHCIHSSSVPVNIIIPILVTRATGLAHLILLDFINTNFKVS
jgi:hypothetical protein